MQLKLLKNDFHCPICIVSAWDELEELVIDTAVQQWQTRLHACIKVEGSYFKHIVPEKPLIMVALCNRTDHYIFAL